MQLRMSTALLTADTTARVEDNGAHQVPEELLMSTAGYVAAAMVLFGIGFFGFFLNLFVIVLLCKEKQLWTPLNVILFNLVCSDFSVAILGNPFTLASAIAHEWLFGKVMCVIYGFFMSLLGITSITTLTVLAFERYLMVCKPFNSHHLTQRSAGFIVVGIWLYSLALTLPPLFGWGDYVNEAANISCSVNWQEQTLNTMTYILFLFLFGLVVPVAIISFSYVNIIRTMKKNTLRMGRVNKVEGRVTYMVAVMIAAFLVAWTPYAVLALLIQFGKPTYVSAAMAVVPALVAKSSICYNPLIYVGLNTQFRASWRQLLGIRDVGDASMGDNENTIGATRITESVDEKKRYQTFQLTEMPPTACAKARTALLKSIESDNLGSKQVKLLVASSVNSHGVTQTLFSDKKNDENGVEV